MKHRIVNMAKSILSGHKVLGHLPAADETGQDFYIQTNCLLQIHLCNGKQGNDEKKLVLLLSGEMPAPCNTNGYL